MCAERAWEVVESIVLVRRKDRAVLNKLAVSRKERAVQNKLAVSRKNSAGFNGGKQKGQSSAE